MKVLKIRVNASTCYVGSTVEDEIEVHVDDNATEKEIEDAKEAAARDWMHEQIYWGWVDVNED